MNESLRIRRAVRAVLLDPANQLLLVRFVFPDVTLWALPGGGIEPGESPVDALRRELREEVGLHNADIGAHVWHRTNIIPFLDGSHDGQRDDFYLVRSDGFEPSPALTWEELNAEYVFEMRWWTLDEIASSSELFAPRSLGVALTRLLAEGAPQVAIDVGV